MGLIKKKKKKVKAKKPMTTDRFAKIIMPILFIGIIVFSIMNGGFTCDNPFGGYNQILDELSKPFDVESVIGEDRLLASDKQTLKEKLGDNGAGLNIILDGEISAELYNDYVTLAASQDFSITDVEMGQFCNIVWNDAASQASIQILALSIIESDNMQYNISMVYNIDIGALTSAMGNGLEKVKNIYVRSAATASMTDGMLVVVGSNSQINELSADSNSELVQLVNGLVGSTYDAGAVMLIGEINELATKVSADIIIDSHIITFDI